jgi:hypothetical protein
MSAPFAHAGWLAECSEAGTRRRLNDDDFWAQVNRNLGLAPDPVDIADQYDQAQLDDLVQTLQTTCPVCGSGTACAYDSEGQPLIHATPGQVDL